METKTNLEIWNELNNKYDLLFYSKLNKLTKTHLEQMRENWKALRRFALSKLNQELNNSGIKGTLLNMDVSDCDLYPFIPDDQKYTFYRYSRLLDFSDGYKPKDIIIIKK